MIRIRHEVTINNKYDKSFSKVPIYDQTGRLMTMQYKVTIKYDRLADGLVLYLAARSLCM